MKCAVRNCKQYATKKHRHTYLSFYKFPKNDPERKQWVKFCNKVRPVNVNAERVCALHFKEDDFERNLQFEMGFSSRRTLKLKPGAVPSITSTIGSKEGIGTDEEESLQHNAETNSVMTENDYGMQIKTLEAEMDALRQENGKLKAAQSQSDITLKDLSHQVQKLRCENESLVKAAKCLFTQGQIRKLKNGDIRQTFKRADIAQSITLYLSSAKAYRTLRNKKKLPTSVG